jgi:hypothetical protein
MLVPARPVAAKLRTLFGRSHGCPAAAPLVALRFPRVERPADSAYASEIRDRLPSDRSLKSTHLAPGSMGESATSSPQPLDWLPYHRAIIDYLKEVDRYVWDWFSKSVVDPKSADEVRFDLLKSTYRIDRESQTSLYETAADVARRLGIEARVSIYQAQNPMGLNASLAYVPAEIHIVLHGPIAEKLTEVEIQALFGHEMGHYLLRHRNFSEAQIAAEMLHALCNDFSSHSAHFASARLLQLYDEIFCDRASYVVTSIYRPSCRCS